MGRNAFGIKLKNTTPDKQNVKLFELGASGDDVPVPTLTATSGDDGVVLLSGGTAWTYNGDLPTSDEFEFISNDLLEADTGIATICNMNYSDGETDDISGSISVGDDLTRILGYMKSSILGKNGFDADAGTEVFIQAITQYRSTDDYLLIRFVVFYNLLNLDLYSAKLQTINYVNPAIETYTFPDSIAGGIRSGGDVTPNGVEVNSQSGTSYKEILESQAGSVLEITYLDLNTFGGGGIDTQSQLLNCLKFKKKNANGNDQSYWRCPTIDVYQFQDTLRYVGLNNEADRYTLDGRTEFEYSLEGNATISLDFAYTDLPNIAFMDESRVENIVDKAEKRKGKLEELTRFSKTKFLVAEKQNKEEEQFVNFINNEVKKKDKSLMIMGIMGIVGIFFLIK